jgi:uncharacterized membrane protein
MEYEKSLTVEADPARVWKVLSDIERWPERITTYQEVRRLDGGDLRVGSRAHVKQKGLAAGDWTVTELEPGRVFAWESRQPGVRIVGRHVVAAEPDGGSRLTLQLEMSGWMSGLIAMALGRKSRAYVDLECARLSAVAAEPTRA